MKIFVLTTGLTQDGWGRYSADVACALSQNNIGVVVAINESSVNETNVDAVKILPNHLAHIKVYVLAFWYAWKLRKYAKECDVIHCFAEPYSYIAYWLSKMTGKKYFITAHGTYGVLPYYFSSIKKYFHKKSFESAEKVICVSNYTKDLLFEFGLKNLIVVNNGIHFENFYCPPIVSFAERGDIILSVGALKPRKGQYISIAAFAKIANRYKNLKYYVVGDQSDVGYFEKLKQLATTLGVKDRVIFLSSISDDELKSLYGKSKIFVLTSRSKKSHFEGFGLVYLEANANGLPVIGSIGSGAEDAIRDGKTGFLVPQEDVGAIAKKMSDMLESKELWKEMSGNGIIWAKEHDWNGIIKKYIEVYNSK